MSKKTLTYLGIAAAIIIVGYLIYDNNKPAKKQTAAGKQGTLKNDAQLFMLENGVIKQMNSKLKQGEKVTIRSEYKDYYKVDCDEIYVQKSDVQLI